MSKSIDRYEREQDDLQARADARGDEPAPVAVWEIASHEQLRETALAQLEDAEREIDDWLEAIDELDDTPVRGLRLA